MASMIMASTQPIVPITSSLPPKPKLQQIPQLSLQKIPTPKFLKSQQILSLSSSTLKSISLLTVTSLSFAPPSLAAEIEKAALFDFNLTLPIMMVQFLLLMFALDKIYFTPLGKFMDERDAAIKEELAGVKDTSKEVKQLEEQAAAIMRAARAEISAALNKMKKETQLEVDRNWLKEGRKLRLNYKRLWLIWRNKRKRLSSHLIPRLLLSVRTLSRSCSLSKSSVLFPFCIWFSCELTCLYNFELQQQSMCVIIKLNCTRDNLCTY